MEKSIENVADLIPGTRIPSNAMRALNIAVGLIFTVAGLAFIAIGLIV